MVPALCISVLFYDTNGTKPYLNPSPSATPKKIAIAASKTCKLQAEVVSQYPVVKETYDTVGTPLFSFYMWFGPV